MSSAWRRQLRGIDRDRARLERRGIAVVAGGRVLSSAAPVRPGYWSRRLGLDTQLGKFVRIAVRRPVPT